MKLPLLLLGTAVAASGAMAAPSLAQTMDVTVAIPRMTVAEDAPVVRLAQAAAAAAGQELSIKLGEKTAVLRPRIEAVLRRYKLEYELRGQSEDEVSYHVLAPLNLHTDRVSNALTSLVATGKGAVEYYVAVIKPGRILYEMEGVTEDIAKNEEKNQRHGFARITGIGPITAATARELGFDGRVEAQRYTLPGLVEAVLGHYAPK